MVRHFRLLTIGVALTVGGCDPDSSVNGPGRLTDPELTASSAFPGVVTDPAPSSTVGAGQGVTAGAEAVYVSLPPRVVPSASAATIVNYRTNGSVSTPIVDGGFDPVAIGARAADTILITFRLIGGGTRRTWSVVPQARQPVVVRIDPSAGTLDVPLDASMRVVFSEPIDPASVSTSTITLRVDDEVIAGSVEVSVQESWIARFTPAAPLEGDVTYQLVATDQVRDLDGERLEPIVPVSFTTVATNRPNAGQLAFSAWDGSAMMIYRMNPDGSQLAVVTQGMDPSYSPDGKQIAFWRYAAGSGGVYIASADGSNIRRVIAEGHQPTWSPDGRRLAYGCGGICLINVDGTGRTRLTPPAPKSEDASECVRDTDPTWSPDGSTIAFTRWPDARIPASMCLPLGIAVSFPFDFSTEVWLINADGSNLRPVRDADGFTVSSAGWPSWSPDGKRLAFYYTGGGEERIDVASADGSGIVTVVRQRTLWDIVLGSPDWSPDGNRIVFTTRDGWGFAEASGSGGAELVTSPHRVVPNSLSWSWARR